jgi:pyruvate formate lyase activating enzyme
MQAMDYPIKGFIETSFSDWPGKVASVIFLPSCNFRCGYCHNHELVLRPDQYPNYPLREIIKSLQARKGWIDGVCISGGEPTLHPWLFSLIQELRNKKELGDPGTPLGIKLDTNGSRPDVLERLIVAGLVDYVAMDLKGPLVTKRYANIVGIPLPEDLTPIQRSIEILQRGKVDYEFRTTLVPTLIGEEEVVTLANQVRGAPRYTLQNFRPTITLDESFQKVAPWDEKNLRRLQTRVNEIIH